MKRHEDREKMEEEIRHALARAREEQSRLEETAQQRFAAAMRLYAEKEMELVKLEKKGEGSEDKKQEGEQEKENDEERREKVKAIKQEMEQAAAAARKAVRDRMDFERTEGLEEENEYILRRVLGGKGTAYEICSEEDMRRMLVLAMEHHLATRGVDHAAVRRREKDGQLTDADRAVIEWAEDNSRKAHWPRNALYAARRIDAERDEERKKEGESRREEEKKKQHQSE